MSQEVLFFTLNKLDELSKEQKKYTDIAKITLDYEKEHPENKMFLKEVDKLKTLKTGYQNIQIFTNF